MVDTVEVPASMVLVCEVPASTVYIMRNEVLDILHDAIGLRAVPFANDIFRVTKDPAMIVRDLEHLRKVFEDEWKDRRSIVTNDNPMRDKLVILQYNLKEMMLQAYKRGDNTALRAGLLFYYINFLIGRTLAPTFLHKLDYYIELYRSSGSEDSEEGDINAG